MQISSNIVRFPPPTLGVESVRRERAHPDNVIAFVPPAEDALSQVRSQEYGKVFSAQRIATRVADELDAVAVL